ncbi:MAG: transcriptional repressor [Bacteroidaceae bacterium]|jgi:Fur family ferric uptake transcriptional regulator|nr:transcriptional repressor [Bacteroidaceae bacterium]MBR6169539.1 transcriptional repressor [Bacteroidaceae bacterium]
MSENTDLYNLAAQLLTEYIKGKNIRKTPERFEILRIICQISGIFSIDELQEIMEKEAKFKVSRVTLFNTLKLFEDASLVIKHTLVRAAHYECCVTPHPLVCLVCQKCGTVKKLESSKIENWLSEQKCKQFVITQPVLYFHGLCRSCMVKNSIRKKKAKTKGKETKQKTKIQKK